MPFRFELGINFDLDLDVGATGGRLTARVALVKSFMYRIAWCGAVRCMFPWGGRPLASIMLYGLCCTSERESKDGIDMKSGQIVLTFPPK